MASSVGGPSQVSRSTQQQRPQPRPAGRDALPEVTVSMHVPADDVQASDRAGPNHCLRYGVAATVTGGLVGGGTAAAYALTGSAMGAAVVAPFVGAIGCCFGCVGYQVWRCCTEPEPQPRAEPRPQRPQDRPQRRDSDSLELPRAYPRPEAGRTDPLDQQRSNKAFFRADLPATNQAQVAQVLAQMGHPGLAHRLPDFKIEYFDYRVISEEFGIAPGPQGLRLLAAYYERKYGTSIVFPRLLYTPDGMREVGRLIDKERASPQGDVRRAFYIGEEGKHACAAVYVREGGREAVVWFDSIEGDEGSWRQDVKEALAAHCSGLPMYAHFAALQKDKYSCFSQTMNACVTLTERTFNEDGTRAFTLPNLLSELEARQLGVDEGTGVRRIRPVPELTKMAQSRTTLNTAAGHELDLALRGSRRGRTLQDYLDLLNRPQGPQEQYRTGMGARYAKKIEIEKWNQAIRNELGDQWDDAKMLEFAQRMKDQIFGPADERAARKL